MNSQSIMGRFSLDGKTALVTGACYGIGFAIANALHAAGAKVVFNATKQESVDNALKAYAEEGLTDVKGYVCDVTDAVAVNALIAKIEKDVAPIDILVNNAGIIKRIPMCDMAEADFRRVIDVDLVAPFIVAKAVLPGMIARGHGKIINVCSLMSQLGRETVSAYAAAKGGLKMLTQNICSEFGGQNIQCNASSSPAPAIVSRSFHPSFPPFLRIMRNATRIRAVKNIRHQVITPLESSISFPRIPVNPAKRIDK